MPDQWIQVRRRDPSRNTGIPLITIRNKDAALNAAFVKEAEIEKYKEAKILIDPINRKIAFEFLKEHDPNAFAIHGDGGGATNRGRGRTVTSSEIFMKIPWIRPVATDPDPLKRQFKPEWDNIRRLWIITLMPMFEKRVTRNEVPSGVKGIYRYVRNNGDIVYIGKGNIKERLSASERIDWDFDFVEYSEIEADGEQYKWEKWWIDEFEQDKGELPIYNRIGGRAVTED